MTISLTTAQLEQRLDWVEAMLATAHAKNLPYLNQTYQRIIDELVRRDREAEDERAAKNTTRSARRAGNR